MWQWMMDGIWEERKVEVVVAMLLLPLLLPLLVFLS